MKYLTEFIGTFFLVFTICMTAFTGNPSAALAIGSVLMAMVFMGGHVSGAHYNPAVSLAVWLRGKMATKDIIPYCIAQIGGAIAASLIAFAILRPGYAAAHPNGPALSFAIAPSATTSTGVALLVEFLFTFALALVVLNAATAKGTANNSFYGLAIGFTVTGGALAVGGITGAVFNPAVAIGPNLVNALMNHGSLSSVWIYLVACLAGGAAAAGVFKIQNPEV